MIKAGGSTYILFLSRNYFLREVNYIGHVDMFLFCTFYCLLSASVNCSGRIVGFLMASMELILSPVILNMWALHVSDPFISIDVIEVLEVITCLIDS